MATGVDVLVVGLGPAGAATAIRLARAGFEVMAIDRARFPRDKACSEYMSPETLRQLDRLGVLPLIDVAGGARPAGVRVVGPRGSDLEGRFARAGGGPFRSHGLALSRRILDHVLVDAARTAGVRVVERCRLGALRLEGGAVAGAVLHQLSGSSEVRARLTVGADGLHSIVARRLGRRRHAHPSRLAFVAHVRGVRRMTELAELHVSPHGYVGLNQIEDGLTNVAVVVPTRLAARASPDPTAFWYRTLESLPEIRGRVDPGEIGRPVLATGPFAAWSSRVFAPGALLVGDAADFFDPFTGEGICTALEGAELVEQVASRALAKPGIARGPDLAPYQHTRRRRFLGKWAIERLIGYGMLAPRFFDRAVARLDRRQLADTLVGVTGRILPPSRVFRPGFLSQLVV